MRLKVTDYDGPYVMHCHWAAHSDSGCMNAINVAGDTSPPAHVYEDADPNVKNTYATTTQDQSSI